MKKFLNLSLMLALAVILLSENVFGGLSTSETEAAMTLSNPSIVTDSSMKAGQKVTWDCVWFGSYPQTEVVSEEDTTKIAALKNMNTYFDTEYETVSAAKFAKIKNASYDSNGDATVGTQRYRRMKYSNATYASISDDAGNYDWNNDRDAYHYFKYEPIKWRVLKVENGRALLLSDLELDNQKYNTEDTDITWEKSTIRSFLNSYGTAQNTVGINYSAKGFLNSAFSTSERSAIQTAALENADNLEYGVEGGNNTSDKIFLLSESEVYNTETAASYGFVKEAGTSDEARRSGTSTYAYAMGAWRDSDTDEGKTYTYAGNSTWWLRSPGNDTDCAAEVSNYGYVIQDGYQVRGSRGGVRPALYLNLSATGQYSSAGTVCSDGTVKEKKKQTVKVKSIRLTGISKKIAAGKKIKLTATITPMTAANKKLKWTTSNKKVATVTQTGIVKMKKRGKGKYVTITAKALDGSGKKATYKIKSMKGVVKKVTIKGKKSVKAGKKLKLKAKVKATKGANKKLFWKSSNAKYATVNSKGVAKTKKAGKGKKVKITAMATDGSGKKATIKIKIK